MVMENINEGVHIRLMMEYHQERKGYYVDMTRRLDPHMKLTWDKDHDYNFAYAEQCYHISEYMDWLTRLHRLRCL
jgi:hypothetical protein